MKKKLSITLNRSLSPITEPVTKFGGQPVWLTEPQWPISKQAEEPMMFIAQVVLEPAIFGDIQGQMAYLFMTGDDYDVDGTFDPDDGENAVILQPGISDIETRPLIIGPSLFGYVQDGKHHDVPV